MAKDIRSGWYSPSELRSMPNKMNVSLKDTSSANTASNTSTLQSNDNTKNNDINNNNNNESSGTRKRKADSDIITQGTEYSESISSSTVNKMVAEMNDIEEDEDEDGEIMLLNHRNNIKYLMIALNEYKSNSMNETQNISNDQIISNDDDNNNNQNLNNRKDKPHDRRCISDPTNEENILKLLVNLLLRPQNIDYITKEMIK